MANQNFGFGCVDPENGSNGNDGYWWDTPKQTIESAVTAGFSQIHILAGAHTVSTFTAPVELVLYPGKHFFNNGPVVCTAPINVVGYRDIAGADAADVATVSVQGSVTDFFQIDNGASNIDGCSFVGVRFDLTNTTRSAVYTSNVSHLVAENCNWVGEGTFAARPLFYASVSNDSGVRSSWWRLDSNRVNGGQLLVVDNDYAKSMNGWVVRSNRCYGASGATSPFVHVAGSNGRSQGWAITGNTFDGVSSATAAVHLDEPANQFYWYGNRGRNLTNSNNLILKTDDVASAYIEQSLGDVASDGNVNINGTIYSQTAPDTGTDGRGGRDTYRTADDVRVVIMGRY